MSANCGQRNGAHPYMICYTVFHGRVTDQSYIESKRDHIRVFNKHNTLVEQNDCPFDLKINLLNKKGQKKRQTTASTTLREGHNT